MLDEYYAGPAEPPPAVPEPPRRVRAPRRRGRLPSAATAGAALCSTTAALPGVATLRAGMRMVDGPPDDFLGYLAPLVGLGVVAVGLVLAIGALMLPLALLIRAPGARYVAFAGSAVAVAAAAMLAFDSATPLAVRRLSVVCALGAVATVALLRTGACRADFLVP